jgi:hypothetical protein
MQGLREVIEIYHGRAGDGATAAVQAGVKEARDCGNKQGREAVAQRHLYHAVVRAIAATHDADSESGRGDADSESGRGGSGRGGSGGSERGGSESGGSERGGAEDDMHVCATDGTWPSGPAKYGCEQNPLYSIYGKEQQSRLWGPNPVIVTDYGGC